jgi:hypothetical protein
MLVFTSGLAILICLWRDRGLADIPSRRRTLWYPRPVSLGLHLRRTPCGLCNSSVTRKTTHTVVSSGLSDYAAHRAVQIDVTASNKLTATSNPHNVLGNDGKAKEHCSVLANCCHPMTLTIPSPKYTTVLAGTISSPLFEEKAVNASRRMRSVVFATERSRPISLSMLG